MATGKYKNSLLFDYLGNILKTKSLDLYRKHIDDVEFASSFQGFMILRFLSMSESKDVRNLILANQLNLERLPARVLYKFLLMNVPRQSSAFIKYIK